MTYSEKPWLARMNVSLEYNPDYHPMMGYKYALLFATNKEIAHFFEISDATFDLWMASHAEFKAAIAEGRGAADANVSHSLHRRALGYTINSEKVYADPRSGEVVRVPIVEHVPADPGAAKYWLAVRQPKKWRESKEIVHTVRHDASEFSDEELAAITRGSGGPAGVEQEEGGAE